MGDKFSYTGYWYLGEHKPVAGELKYDSEEGGTLTIYLKEEFIREKKFEIIRGNCKKPITLLHCRKGGFTVSNVGVSTATYKSSNIFVDVAFEKEEEIEFDSISVNFPYLAEWACISGFKISNNTKLKKSKVEFKIPKAIQLLQTDPLKLSISFGGHLPEQAVAFSQKEVSLGQKTFLTIELTNEKKFSDYLKIIDLFQKFLSFAVSAPSVPISIQGINKKNIRYLGKREYIPSIEIHYPGFIHEEKLIHPNQILFTLKDIEENTLKNWFQKEYLHKVFDLFFAVQYIPHIYLEHQFLTYTQALETLHRRVYKNYKKPEQDRRLREIMELFKDFIYELIPEKNFVKDVVITRNYLTHYDVVQESASVKGENLSRLSEKLQMLLEALILKELNFDIGKIKGFITRKYDWLKINH
ncbi:MAG: ApeA N-terminal domain 1-containing protein [Nitrospirota bacterium]